MEVVFTQVSDLFRAEIEIQEEGNQVDMSLSDFDISVALTFHHEGTSICSIRVVELSSVIAIDLSGNGRGRHTKKSSDATKREICF